ncbi:hypothetical protein CCP3SC15_1280006 [Gammaproteobacteria bacterium]
MLILVPFASLFIDKPDFYIVEPFSDSVVDESGLIEGERESEPSETLGTAFHFGSVPCHE